MLKTRPTRLLATALLAALSFTATACGKKHPPMPPPGPPEVGFVTIQPQRVALTTELSGRTAPYLIAEVRPQVGGIIKQRLFTEGSDVKAGQVLYQIDPASYEAALASARANQAKAEATLGSIRLKAERYGDLVNIKAVSQQDTDDAQASLKQAEAEVAAAKAAVDTARINLAYTRITSPIAGRIGRSTVTEGALVTANQQTTLATVQQFSTMYVDVTQSSAELLTLKRNLASGLLKQGNEAQAKVRLFLEDGSLYPLSGSLKFSEVTVEQSTGSVTLRAVFPNPKQELLPGMFVRAVLEEGTVPDGILVPQRGVTRNPKGEAVVMTVGAEEKVEPRLVKVVRTVGDAWLVGEGLKPGERVILEGLQRARPGSPVKAVPFGSKPAVAPTQPTAEKAQEPAKK